MTANRWSKRDTDLGASLELPLDFPIFHNYLIGASLARLISQTICGALGVLFARLRNSHESLLNSERRSRATDDDGNVRCVEE